MATLITDPQLEQRVHRERRASGVDRYDEVWDGVYLMTPMPNDQHQEIVSRLVSILEDLIGWPGAGKVRPGVNLSDRAEGWDENYRVPDVAVFLNDTAAHNHESHWQGAADFLIEVVSPNDRAREKIAFYSQLGVRELLVIDRGPWRVELFRHTDDGLTSVAVSEVDDKKQIVCETVPISLRLVSGDDRPHIEVVASVGERTWRV
jgi:Uma2 family endonuclease